VVIDAHHHLWDLAAREHRWLMGGQTWASDDELAELRRSYTRADLAPLAAAAGITGTVVIQTVTEPWETEDLLALAAGHDPYQAEEDRGGTAQSGDARPAPTAGLLAGVVGWTDLTAPEVADVLAGLRELPGGEVLSGIRSWSRQIRAGWPGPRWTAGCTRWRRPG
jgi:L-fuconolactonase